MKKKIIIDNFETHFYIDEKGTVINSLNNHVLKGTIRDGYRYYDLRFNNTKKSKSAHRLVAEHFIDNPDNLEIVHHKNGNRLDNRIENLEWVSYSTNNLKSNKFNTYTSDYVQIKNGVKWYNYKNTVYAVSDTGEIRNNKSGKLLKGKITNGYREYCLTINGKKKSLLGHRIAYKAFHPGEKLKTINHINGDKLDNSIENLENVSQLINNMKAIYDTEAKVFKKVGQYDKEFNLLKVFTTCAEAAREMHCSPQSINAAIHNNYCSCGYYWKYIEY